MSVVGIAAALTAPVGVVLVLVVQAAMAAMGCVGPAIVLGPVTPGACISAVGGIDRAVLSQLARVGLH